jgi:hypothetical protein
MNTESTDPEKGKWGPRKAWSGMRRKKHGSKQLDELEYLVTHYDSSLYAGVWVAMIDNEVISTGERLKDVLEEVRRKRPGREPFVTKLPKDPVMVL